MGEIPAALGEWWEDFSLGSDEERRALVEAARGEDHARRGAALQGTDTTAEQADPARKRRRRRRKPAGSGASTGAAGGSSDG